MTSTERNTLVTLVFGGCLAWMAVVGWLLFAHLPRGAVENHGSDVIKDRMATECQGTFKERYNCKEAIIVESGRDTFWVLASRFLAVIVPPLFASIWLSSYLHRHPVKLAIRHVEASPEWKTRAYGHVNRPVQGLYPDEQDGHSAGSDGRPVKLIDQIAPLGDIKEHERAPEPDWKAKARSHVSGHQPPES